MDPQNPNNLFNLVDPSQVPSEITLQLATETLRSIKSIIANRSVAFFTSFYMGTISQMPQFTGIDKGLLKALCRQWACAGKTLNSL